MATARDGKTHSEGSDLAISSAPDLDDNYNLYKQQAGEPLDPDEAKRVLRKIDLRVIPIFFMIYLLQYLDKNSINFASVYGLIEDTHLVGQQYSWLSSIFYFGYLISQYPSGYLLQRLPIAKVLSCTTLLWGVIVITTPACHNFAGIAVNRFLLGFVEATLNPGFVLVMSVWYTTAEQPLRLESYYCTNGVATMFGGLIGYAVGHITTGLPKWMYVFLIFGSCSIAAGIWSFLVLPDQPATAKFLSERERGVAVERVVVNRQGIKNHHFKTYQMWQTLRDPKTWILFIMAVAAQIPNSAITSVSHPSVPNIKHTNRSCSSPVSSSKDSGSAPSELNIFRFPEEPCSSLRYWAAVTYARHGPTLDV